MVTAALLVASAAVSACGSGSGPVVVGSFDTDESVVLAHLYAELLEGNGIDAEVRERMGVRADVLRALEDGEITLYPEYSGDALDFLAGRSAAVPDVAETASALRRLVERRGSRVFDPSGASRQLAVVVTYDLWDRTGVYSLTGLAELDEPLTLAVPQGCQDDPACLPGFERVYGLEPGEIEVIDGGPDDALAALHRGVVDAVVVPTTEGSLAGSLDVVLVDDRAQQPANNVIPVSRDDDDNRRERVYRTLDRLSEELTTADLRELNRRTSVGDEEPSDVAKDLLEDKGLIQ